MYLGRLMRLFTLMAILLGLVACDDITDDLQPSGQDKRETVTAGTIGPEVSQIAPDFTLSDTLYTGVTLSSELATADAVVLYFTMWCPTCDLHMSHMRDGVVRDFPNVTFLLVDYVSGSVANARSAQLANGYGDFRVIVDEQRNVEALYNSTMGTTVVIDNTGVVRMNEDYKDGSKLRTVLEGL